MCFRLQSPGGITPLRPATHTAQDPIACHLAGRLSGTGSVGLDRFLIHGVAQTYHCKLQWTWNNLVDKTKIGVILQYNYGIELL